VLPLALRTPLFWNSVELPQQIIERPIADNWEAAAR